MERGPCRGHDQRGDVAPTKTKPGCGCRFPLACLRRAAAILRSLAALQWTSSQLGGPIFFGQLTDPETIALRITVIGGYLIPYRTCPGRLQSTANR